MKKQVVKNDAVGLSAPPYRYREMLAVFFRGDPNIRVGKVEEDGDGVFSIPMYVSDADVYRALGAVLRTKRKFGSQTVVIDPIPANKRTLREVRASNGSPKTKVEFLREVLRNNEWFGEIVSRTGKGGIGFTYAMMLPYVFQYRCDNIASPFKLCTTVAEDVARIVFKNTGVAFATEEDGPDGREVP